MEVNRKLYRYEVLPNLFIGVSWEIVPLECIHVPEVGKVLCNVLFLNERDDNLASDLFIEYYEEKLKALERNLNNVDRNINALKGGFKDV